MGIHLSDYIDSQEIKDMSLQDQNVGVWCTIAWNWIICPIFFSDTVSVECYHKMILCPFVVHLFIQGRTCLWLLTTGWCCHTHSSCTLLCSLFRDKIMLKYILRPWWPILMCPDYCLCSTMKNTFFKGHPCTLLKAIIDLIRNIPAMIVICLFRQDATCRCVSTRTWEPFQTYVVTYVSEMYLN
jgi:hypothetical protein